MHRVSQDQLSLRPFGTNGLSSAGNPGITFLAPSAWCSSSAVAGMSVAAVSIPGIQIGQITGQMQIVGLNACLYSDSAENGFIWGGSATDGQFQCNSPSQPLGEALNTFTSYFADDSTGTLYVRLVPDAGSACGIAAVVNSAGQQQLTVLTSCNTSDPSEQFTFIATTAASSSNTTSASTL